MARKIDPDDLLDGVAVAELLGWSGPKVVSVIRSRHPDFPQPVVELGRGRPTMWLRADVEAWARATGRL